ncbi:40S ribosomal protein eS10 [Aspergillus mulundensis]|uniref:40S ribosomal protein S10-B n=1 Tax=Aspergillus mulundensis TaxID=1810919 RepID=A0A3D8T692_9EURO|nr:40S ribosomal protein S10-B [Aspergillus mulundensis]RDW94065.1 40S ribosomal protein S10-B [Aspergillus mulundensis]
MTWSEPSHHRKGNDRTFNSAASLHSNIQFQPPLRALSERFPEEQQELATMLIPKEDRKKIHEYLFREGVLVAKKDFNLPKHGDIDTKNLYVIKALQSLNSRGYVKTQFSWQYYYYTLTPEGLDYLREWLHLPAEVVPATHIKQQRSHAPPRGMMGGEERERRPRPPREGGYRRREEGKEGGAPGEFAPSFRGGFGRGRGAPPS